MSIGTWRAKTSGPAHTWTFTPPEQPITLARLQAQLDRLGALLAQYSLHEPLRALAASLDVPRIR